MYKPLCFYWESYQSSRRPRIVLEVLQFLLKNLCFLQQKDIPGINLKGLSCEKFSHKNKHLYVPFPGLIWGGGGWRSP